MGSRDTICPLIIQQSPFIIKGAHQTKSKIVTNMGKPPPGYDPMKPRFYIDKEGNWYQDGLPILHKRTYLENNRNLRRDEEGRYYVQEGRFKVYAVVEDTPFVVRGVVERDNKLYVVLNDETQELLDFDSLEFSDDNVPYVRVKKGEFLSRFTRPAYYELVKFLKEEGGNFYIEYGGEKYPIRRRQP